MTAGPDRPETAPPAAGPSVLRAALERGGEVVRAERETHISWVVLTDEHAYKLKKPLSFAFADLSTPERRRAACEEEVRVNRPLARDLDGVVLALVAGPGGWALGAPEDGRAREWVVRMRRFDEGRTLAALLAADAVPPAALDEVAVRLVRFHAAASAVFPDDPSGEVRARLEANLDELAAGGRGRLDQGALDSVRRFVRGALAAHGGELAGRGREGFTREGHGDLRAEHVVLPGDGDPMIVDRLEFDPALRILDVADDLAFLVMDLEDRKAGWAARRLVAGYRAAGGDPGSDGLIALYAVHRALVRAKVAILRADQEIGSAREGGEAAARRLVALAGRLAWRARGPLLLLVYGPPASGKSTLAGAFAAAADLPVLSSDLLRKARLGLPADARASAAAYTPAARGAIYRRLGDRAAEELRRRGAVIDATFGDRSVRGPFFSALGSAERVFAVACDVPADVRRSRAAARRHADAGGSDAGPAVAARAAGCVDPLDELPRSRRLTVDSRRPSGALVAEVAAWLDELAGA